MDAFTKLITIPLSIVKADNIFRLSVTAIGGDIQVRGNFPFTPTVGGIQMVSDWIPLIENGTVVLVAAPNSGIVFDIDPLAASAAVMLYFN